jgi:DNA-binding PadR family transcriptional regulator
MSPVFRHGRLRLYLLKLLDESPRHGYEVIRLLQDRFMGVYAPSPGTIYPRLARLEEEGLVTHDEADGRKVYRITDKGREELHARLDDLTELEEEITASVRDIAREVTEDVRETVRTLREELTWAAREFHTRARPPAGDADQGPADGAPQAREEARSQRDKATDDARQQRDAAYQDRDRARDEARRQRDAAYRQRDAAHDEARHQRDDARHQRDEARRERDAAAQGRDGTERDRQHEHEGTERDRWHEHAGRHWGYKEWGDWASWAGPQDCPDPRAYRDLERLAKQFSRDLRHAAWQAQAVSEDAVRDLRGILDETIDRIKAEVFGAKAASPQPGGPDDAGASPADAPGE